MFFDLAKILLVFMGCIAWATGMYVLTFIAMAM